jgi:fibronectin-binding autotransporter adhesin
MNKQQFKAAVSSVILGILSPLAIVAPVSAADVTWVDTETDSLFSTDSNWVGGVAPVNGNSVVFPASAKFQFPENDLSSLSLVKIIFNGAVTGTSSKSYTVTGNALTLTSGIDAVMTGNGGDHSVETSITLGAATTFKTTGSNTLHVGGGATDDGVGAGSPPKTTLDLAGNNLTLDASGGTISLSGDIKGAGNITVTGNGKVVNYSKPVSGGGYNPTVTVGTGVYTVNSSTGDNISLSGGTLKGTGTVGSVTMASGTVAPGASPGVLNTGPLTYTGGTFDVELGGTGAGQFDQTNVTGTVNLGTATNLTITLTGGYEPAINDAFIIVNNNGTDAVEGNFNGLADGDKIYGAYTYQINYNGGDGNDVVLLVTGNPGAPDTGVNSIIGNPIMTLFAALAVAGTVVGYRFYETKKHINKTN